VAYLICTCCVLVAYLRRIRGVYGLYLWRIVSVSFLYRLSKENAQASKCLVELPVTPYRFLLAVRVCECCTRCWVMESEYVGRVGVRYWFAVEMCGLSGFC
jgi:hypothetical protein